MDYADTTPDIAYTYDAMGRQTQVVDAAGTTTFVYNAFGDVVSESNLRTLTRHYDTFGRDVGYSVDGDRKATIVYDPATARIASMDGFVWDYLPGSNLKSRLTYPNGATAEWTYEPKRDLLTRVKNSADGKVLSQFDYTSDTLDRRTTIVKSGDGRDTVTETYAYDTRNRLIAGQGLSYAYDDIGNRTVAEGKTYVANALNQYTKIDDFVPQYDADGNQTLIQTSTGIWRVTYNAENRPILWQSGDTVIEMAFDRMGRRTLYRETKGDTIVADKRFLYRDYLCIAELDATTFVPTQSYVWDPTEPIATRPLVFSLPSGTFFYFHDGNKNSSVLASFNRSTMSLFRYDYTSFGISISTGTIALDAPFRFSSEYYDKTLDLVYYNYRYYNPRDGRWCNRDQIAEEGGINLQSFLANNPISLIDDKGMVAVFPVVIATFTANIIPTFLCAYPQYKYVMRSHPGTGDKFKHCLTSCRIAKSCGGTIAELAGLGKEARDRFVSYVCKNFSSLQNSDFCNGGHGDFFDSMRDIEANHQCVGWESYAFGPVGGWIGTLFRQPCECCCEREVGREH